MSFLENLNEAIQNKWKFDTEMPIQTQMIPEMVAGKDIVAESPTGSGKTLAYVLPILQLVDGKKKQTQALIVAPSQELSIQIVNVIREWIEGTDITVAQLIGGANINRQVERLKKKPTIVVGTPGRLTELVNAKRLKPFEIKYVVLDEGDQLLATENRGMVRSIVEATNPERQIAVVSATITKEIDAVVKDLLNDPIRIQISTTEMPKSGNVVHSFIQIETRDKTDALRGISHVKGLRALAFVNQINQVEIREMKLNYNKAPIVVLYSTMKKFERQEALESFRKGEAKILMATDVAARGLDIEGLTHVIHVDVPQTMEQYLHRSGRTGRAGKDGEVLTFLSPHEERDYRRLAKDFNPIQKTWRNGILRETAPKHKKK